MTERSNEPASRTRFDVVYARHYDRDRAIRKVSRYLGPDIGDWDDRFGPDSVT